MNGVQILLVIGAGIAISALAHRRGIQPGRDAIQVIALVVTLGTLLIQGTTVRRAVAGKMR
ncbi:hypothetical protein [Actinoplanes sp. NPDC049316]|uniref:hypothetical protein n=1 Tax=Actinoplanes sp. NPDC049316 TaxID=3154727 RepID=UPI00342C5916